MEKLGCLVYQRNEGDFGYHKTNHIGGSQAGIILGVNKYTSPLELYLQKTGVVSKEQEENKYAEWGIALEPVIADKFAAEHGEFRVEVVEEILQNKKYPFMIANIDRLLTDRITGERGVLEIKTTTQYNEDAWEDSIPLAYYAQLQHYMMALDVSFGYFAVLIGGSTYKDIRVERDEGYIEALLEKEKAFIKAVEDKDESSLKEKFAGNEHELDFLNPIIEEVNEVLVIEDSEEEDNIIANIKALAQKLKELKAEKTKLESEIKYKIKGHSGLETNNFRVSYTTVTKKGGIDAKRLATEFPEVFNAVQKEGISYKRFSVKKKKK